MNEVPLNASACFPFLHVVTSKLRAVVSADRLWSALPVTQLIGSANHALCAQAHVDPDCQRVTRTVVDHVECRVGRAIGQAVAHDDHRSGLLGWYRLQPGLAKTLRLPPPSPTEKYRFPFVTQPSSAFEWKSVVRLTAWQARESSADMNWFPMPLLPVPRRIDPLAMPREPRSTVLASRNTSCSAAPTACPASSLECCRTRLQLTKEALLDTGCKRHASTLMDNSPTCY